MRKNMQNSKNEDERKIYHVYKEKKTTAENLLRGMVMFRRVRKCRIFDGNDKEFGE